MYPDGLEVGSTSSGCFTLDFTTASDVQAFLPQGGSPGALSASATNPTSSSAGVFGGQVVALELNVDFSNAGDLPSGFGGLIYCNTSDSLSGDTIAQILAVANTALGCGTLPSGYSFGTLETLIDDLNLSFDNGTESSFASTHLITSGPCP